MAKQREKKPLEKKNWSQNFNLIGEVKITNFTFKMDEESNKSDWIYNQLNLMINCGEKSCDVTCELMGGYGKERQNRIYVCRKDENGKTNFKDSMTIDWEDRFDEDILSEVGETYFIRVGLEQEEKNGKMVNITHKFITPYDAIAYVKEHLEEGMVLDVKGNIEYSVYNGKVQCKKVIRSIYLSNKEPKDYCASFLQTFLIDKNSVSQDNLDINKMMLYVDGYVIEKFREFNGWDLTRNGEVKGGIFVPLKKRFEYDLKAATPEQRNLVIKNMFKVSKGVTQLTFHGYFIESGATIVPTENDLKDDVKMLIAMGQYTLEQALAECTVNGDRERRMIISRCEIKLVEDESGKRDPQVQKFERVYEEDDLILECLVPKVQEEESEEDDDESLPFKEDETDSNEEEDLAALLNMLK